jgi:hypothetical protein
MAEAVVDRLINALNEARGKKRYNPDLVLEGNGKYYCTNSKSACNQG